MAIEYLLVTFPEQRNVFADGAGVGVTNHILMLPGDEYEITLDGGGYTPESLDVALNGTSLVKPMVVGFTAVPGAAAAPTTRGAPPAPRVAPTPPPTPRPARRTAAAVPAKTPTRGKKNA